MAEQSLCYYYNMTNWLTRLLKTPKTQIGFLLTLIFITAFLNNPSLKIILVFTLSVGSTLLFDLLFVKLRRIKPFFPSASLVTGSIIGLLTSPVVQWYIPIVIAAVVMFSKNFIRSSNRHIFNPAGFGLVVSSLIFSHAISWWGVSWQQPSTLNLQLSISFFILLSPALVSLVRMKRYRITLSFLVVYIIINTILNSLPAETSAKAGKFSIINSLLDPTVLFFSIVMLPEPLTSPNNHSKQILFGVLVALLSIFVSSPILNSKFLIFNSLDPLIFSLLLGNLVFFKKR